MDTKHVLAYFHKSYHQKNVMYVINKTKDDMNLGRYYKIERRKNGKTNITSYTNGYKRNPRQISLKTFSNMKGGKFKILSDTEQIYHCGFFVIKDDVGSVISGLNTMRCNIPENKIVSEEPQSFTFESKTGSHITLQTLSVTDYCNQNNIFSTINFSMGDPRDNLHVPDTKFENCDKVIHCIVSYPLYYNPFYIKKKEEYKENIREMYDIIGKVYTDFEYIEDEAIYGGLYFNKLKGKNMVNNKAEEPTEETVDKYLIKETGVFELDFDNIDDIIDGLREISPDIVKTQTKYGYAVYTSMKIGSVLVILETIGSLYLRNRRRKLRNMEELPVRRLCRLGDSIHVILAVPENNVKIGVQNTLLEVFDTVVDTYGGSVIYHQDLLSKRNNKYITTEGIKNI